MTMTTPNTMLQAEQTVSRQEALNVLALVQHQEHRKKARKEAYKAQWIEDNATY